MMNTLARFIFAVGVSCVSTLTQAQQTTWEAPYRGDDSALLYLPDTNATYWRYGWERETGDKTGVVIRGQIPDARYFSYNVYDDNTKSTLGSYTDFQIVPNDGTVNPFSGKGGDIHSNYTILVLPKGTRTEAKNVLYFPDEVTKVSVFLRHYVPEGTIEGNVPLPTVAIYNPVTKTSLPAPASSTIPPITREEAQVYLVPMLERLIADFKENPDRVVEKIQTLLTDGPLNMKALIASQVVGKSFKLFEPGDKQYSFRLQPAGTYPNEDNYYLGLPVIRTKNQSLLVRVKVPKMPVSVAEYPNADVRYFSLSQGDEYSYTHGTIMDADMKIDSDGFANFIIADDTPEMSAIAKALGVNFMPWLAGDKMLLIYRHMLPDADYAYGIDKVAIYDPKMPAAEQAAVRTIGPYAMTGKLVMTDSLAAMTKFPEF